jgi:hypothetical protein
MKLTHSQAQQYVGKYVNIKTDYWNFIDERVIKVSEHDVVTEYYHHIKTRDDGILRENWIDISRIESIEEA